MKSTSGNIETGTLFIEDVDKVDCCIFDPSQGIVGHSWSVNIQISGNLDHNGFVYDFSDLKKSVKQLLKETIDHALLLPIMSSHVKYSDTETGEHWKLTVHDRLTSRPNSVWEYHCPKGSVYPLRVHNVTRELLEQECERIIKHRVSSDISHVKVELISEKAAPTAAFFQYTHGITNHLGLCQRLFHGHRSLIQVWVGDERRPDLEHYLAKEVFDKTIHIASKKQLIQPFNEDETTIGRRGTEGKEVLLEVDGSMGNYKCKIPAHRVFFVENQTSIESITKQLAQLIKEKEPNSGKVRVQAFEGIGKGALFEI